MTGALSVIRRVVQQELSSSRAVSLGVVTATFPHDAADDQNNYEVNVRLKHEDLELRRVPILTSHIGTVSPPLVGDLVLVGFVDGDLNHAVVVGRLYANADEDRIPPLHKDDEVLIEHRVSDKINQLRFAADGSIFLQREVTKPEDNSEAKATLRLAANGDIELQASPSIFILLKNDGEIQIKADGKPIKIDCEKMTVTGEMEVNGDVTIKSSSTSTKISGNTITGS
jgi:phage gp45-like